jgi:hypothetical protein
MEKKKVTLEMLRASLERVESEVTTLPYFQLAALLFQFDLPGFKERLKRYFEGYILAAKDETFLLNHCTEAYLPAHFTLKDGDRKAVLKWLFENRKIKKLANLAKADAEYPLEKMLFAYIDGTAPELSRLNVDELSVVFKIADWLDGTGIEIPDKNEILYYIKREELLYPLRLITSDFQGRKDVLAYIGNYVNTKSITPPTPLLISGIGGIGKSAVISKFILNLYDHDREGRMPFVYIDFDKPGYSISEPLSLASEGLRQLAIQFPKPEISSIFSGIRKDINTYLEKPERPITKSSTGTRGVFYDSVSRIYLNRYQSELSYLNNPVLVILDSFEEAQSRATYSELDNLFNFFEEIATFIPGIRFILVGRDDLVSTYLNVKRFTLGEFDTEAANGFLATKGIDDKELREKMIGRLGGNPLSLKLAANYVLKNLKSAREEKPDFEKLFEGIDKERIQEQLVRRNLIHAKSEEVRKIAFPGLLVRNITPEVIRHILAVPCGLGDISPQKADEIFIALQEESFLLTYENNTLVFRRDLRVALYSLIIKEYGDKALLIHDLAVAYYDNKPAPADKAECLYHRLKRGDPADIIDTAYQLEMRPYLENALTELPLDAHIRLASFMGITVSDDVIKKAMLPEWEIYMITQITNVFENGDESGLRRQKQMLDLRQDRIGTSALFLYEARLHLRLAEFEKVKIILDNAAQYHEGELPFVLLRSQLDEYILDFDSALKMLRLYSFGSGEMETLSDSVEYIIACMRNAQRTGLTKDANYLLPVAKHISHMLQSGGSSVAKQITLLINALPQPYKASEVFARQDFDNSPKRLLELFEDLIANFLNKTDFRELYAQIQAACPDMQSLEQKMFNKYRLAMRDIAPPGVVDISINDVILYLEQASAGDMGLIAERFLDAQKDREITDAAGSQKPDKNRLIKLVEKNQIEDAIELLRQSASDDYLNNDLILLEAQLNSLERDNRIGLLNYSDYARQHARIVQALLHLIDSWGS